MKKGISIIIITLSIFISGCEFQRWEADKALRIELFQKCLTSLPDGPSHTGTNDWDEVVSACDKISYSQSRSCVKNCDNGY